jgi:hypothetical protein
LETGGDLFWGESLNGVRHWSRWIAIADARIAQYSQLMVGKHSGDHCRD